MIKILRYQISDWSQITTCLSNNSPNLKLSLSKSIDQDILRALILQVVHNKYGVLFSTIITGSGALLSKTDDQGRDIPFMTADQILAELKRYGFYITYAAESNLPANVIEYLTTVLDLGFDKINWIHVKESVLGLGTYWKRVAIVFKSTTDNADLLKFGAPITREALSKKLADNSVMCITNECGMQWDWLTYVANIQDILAENADFSEEFMPTQDTTLGEEFISFTDDYYPVGDDNND